MGYPKIKLNLLKKYIIKISVLLIRHKHRQERDTNIDVHKYSKGDTDTRSNVPYTKNLSPHLGNASQGLNITQMTWICSREKMFVTPSPTILPLPPSSNPRSFYFYFLAPFPPYTIPPSPRSSPPPLPALPLPYSTSPTSRPPPLHYSNPPSSPTIFLPLPALRPHSGCCGNGNPVTQVQLFFLGELTPLSRLKFAVISNVIFRT